ncbi:MAG: TVP38/TMEM64 family protein [Oscillospiraceae bacterium]|nr:TVP38/TMEM64 family protein [Oscillospiraceae bacterium]
MHPNTEAYTKRRRLLAGISIAVVVLLAALVTWFVWSWLSSFSQEGFRDYIRSFGVWGWLVLLLLQFLQVFIALIPGELLESAAGYAFGPFAGTVICYLGVAAASSLVFLLTRRFGVRLVEVFISREKISELRFLNTERKRNALVFLLFFIPGTPKDLLTYFVGLTDMRLGQFLAISLAARIPSVISSTFGGHLLGEGKLWGALLLYGITGAVSIAGLAAYRAIVQRRAEKK